MLKREAKSCWGEVETIEVGRIQRWVVGLTAGEVGLTLAEGKDLLGELGRLVLQGVEKSWSVRPREEYLPLLLDDHPARQREQSTYDAPPVATTGRVPAGGVGGR